MLFAQQLADGEPQPKVGAAGPLGPVVGLGGAFQRFPREAVAVIGHGEAQLAALQTHGDLHPLFGVAPGVGHQVLKHPEHQLLVHIYRAGALGGKAHPLRPPEDGGGVLQQAAEGLELHRRLLGHQVLQPLQLRHALGVALQPGEAALHGGQGLLRLLRGDLPCRQPLQQVVPIPLQYGEGRAQVVGKGGVQAAALLHRLPQCLVVLLQRAPHGLERGAELSQLVAAGLVHGKIQVVVRDFFRRRPQHRQRLFDLPVVEPPRVYGKAENHRDNVEAHCQLPHILVQKAQGPGGDELFRVGGLYGVDLPGFRVYIGVGHGGFHIQCPPVGGDGVKLPGGALLGVVGGDVFVIEGVPGLL